MRILMPCILSPSGISKATREYFKLIRWLGLPISTLLSLDEHLPLLEKSVVDDMVSSSGPIPQGEKFLQLYVGPPGSMGMMCGAAASAGIFFFEGTRLSSIQVAPARMLDVIGAPSTFCLTGLLRSGIQRSKIVRIPFPLDETKWNPSVEPNFPSEGRFRFLFMNSIYERKGLDVLLRAYWQAFSKTDPVELVIKSYRENDRPDPASRFVSLVAEKNRVIQSEAALVRTLDEPMRDEELPSFIKSFDAVVSTHRSEGLGLTPFYAMAIGVPVVSTDYGGVTDFCNDQTAWMVEVDGMSRPSDEEASTFTHLRGAVWAEPSVESASQALRDCAEHWRERATKAEAGRRLVAENHSYAKSAAAMMSILEMAKPGFSRNRSEKFKSERYNGQPFKMIEI